VAAGWRCRAIRIARHLAGAALAARRRAAGAQPQGSFALQGSIHRYHYELDGLLELAHLGRLTLHSRGDGDRDGLETTTAEAQWLNGELTASGQVYWAPALRWQLQLAGRELDPGVLHPDWPGRLSLRAASHGRYDERLDAALTIEELAGTLRNKPVQLTGAARVAGDVYTLEALALRAGDARLQAAGRLDEQWQLAWQLAAPDLADLLPNASGLVQCKRPAERCASATPNHSWKPAPEGSTYQ